MRKGKFMKPFTEFYVQLRENIIIAVDVIRNNKMRSFLTLLGVIIGVMSIIGVQSLIAGFQKSVHEQIEQLGANVFQVQKFPINMSHHDRDKYRNRKITPGSTPRPLKNTVQLWNGWVRKPGMER